MLDPLCCSPQTATEPKLELIAVANAAPTSASTVGHVGVCLAPGDAGRRGWEADALIFTSRSEAGGRHVWRSHVSWITGKSFTWLSIPASAAKSPLGVIFLP